ncbi:putative pentatricopeptide repeat-containing protein [Acorus gramineus]|uniref:Pentatricopeptide repeat-containing protein n=1 Tax=Acorus gramineus TaxID=55184 RepID=A0AAV9AN36_ACOGR|nr:putative pentatricopeptide repeat-containing protein [Acorus gramineus]
MENGLLEKALEFFKTSIGGDLKPDSFALSRVLSVCSRLGDLRNGEWIHQYIEEEDMGSNVFVATSLVDMYAKCGSTGMAREVFDRMVVKDVVSWSAMIGGYSLNGQPKEALELFHLMCSENVKPDEFTVVAVLSACAKLGALDLGDSVRRIIDANVLTLNLVVGTAVIDMYSKCGSVIKAWKAFKDMKGRDRILWNAMICGLALNGHSKPAFGLFGKMEKSGFSPDGNTFVGLLCSCTHSGLVKEGKQYFESMKRVFNLTPKVEHYGCMVDLLGRVGLLDEAYRLIQEMPIEPNSVVWGSLLGACRTYRDTHLAERALKRLIELEPWNAGNYILLSNIYASSARWDDTAKLRETMIERGISKPPAFSWVEVKGVVHEFRVGERLHPSIDAVYAKLEELVKRMRELGHVPASELVMFDVEEEEKEQSIGWHSEKLAVAFALVAVPPGDVIRVVKNLRVCNDCHGFLKLVSAITSREIVVRDNNRFHCFSEGSCSCNDFW